MSRPRASRSVSTRKCLPPSSNLHPRDAAGRRWGAVSAMNPSSGSVQPVAFPVTSSAAGREREPVACVHVRVRACSSCTGSESTVAGTRAFAAELATCGSDDRGRGLAGSTARSPGRRGDASWSAMREEIIPAALDALAAEDHRAAAPRCGHSMGGAMALDVALATSVIRRVRRRLRAGGADPSAAVVEARGRPPAADRRASHRHPARSVNRGTLAGR